MDYYARSAFADRGPEGSTPRPSRRPFSDGWSTATWASTSGATSPTCGPT
ncbi:hypothetical protein NKG05_19035 [Oerskovia sp. M15]